MRGGYRVTERQSGGEAVGHSYGYVQQACKQSWLMETWPQCLVSCGHLWLGALQLLYGIQRFKNTLSNKILETGGECELLRQAQACDSSLAGQSLGYSSLLYVCMYVHIWMHIHPCNYAYVYACVHMCVYHFYSNAKWLLSQIYKLGGKYSHPQLTYYPSQTTLQKMGNAYGGRFDSLLPGDLYSISID